MECASNLPTILLLYHEGPPMRPTIPTDSERTSPSWFQLFGVLLKHHNELLDVMDHVPDTLVISGCLVLPYLPSVHGHCEWRPSVFGASRHSGNLPLQQKFGWKQLNELASMDRMLICGWTLGMIERNGHTSDIQSVNRRAPSAPETLNPGGGFSILVKKPL